MSASLTKPIPVRLTEDTLAELRELEAYTGTDKSKLLRLALKVGLPQIRKRFGGSPRKGAGE